MDTERELTMVINRHHDTVNSEEVKKLKALPLKTKADIEAYIGAIVTHIEEYVEPFFVEYPDAQSVNDKLLNVVDEDDYFDYFSVNAVCKILIIMKLCNNEKYEGYKERRDLIFKKFVAQSERWLGEYKIFQDLVELLDSGKYKELLEVSL